MKKILVLNKTSPWAHIKTKFNMFGVAKKLVKYVVHLSNLFIYKNSYFSSHKLPKLQWTSFWSQGILEVIGVTSKF
jgi:hypothetical protein